MKVHVSTFLNASPTTVWSTVKRKELLHYVIAPMGKFSPLDGITRGPWIPGTAYDGRSFMFSIIPVGTRTILIESVDDRSMTIQSREHGEIGLKKWDHLIAVKPEGDGSRYSDTRMTRPATMNPAAATYCRGNQTASVSARGITGFHTTAITAGSGNHHHWRD